MGACIGMIFHSNMRECVCAWAAVLLQAVQENYSIEEHSKENSNNEILCMSMFNNTMTVIAK